jgi:Domain of unknown function (DUF5666)
VCVTTTRVNPRLIRFAGLAAGIAVIAFAITVCSPSHDRSSSTGKPTVSAIPPTPAPSAAPPPGPSPPPAPPPAALGNDYVEGMVQSVSGDTIGLRTRTGSATVEFSPSTPVFQVTPARLADVAPGSCVNVRATPQSAPGGAGVTAETVMLTSPVDGKCPPPAGFYGTVASVSGNTIAVSGLGPAGNQAAATAVTVTDATSYKRQTVSSAQAIANGTCMGAQGNNDGGGLQATMISLEQCPPMGSPHHHPHIPHLPHLPHLHL